MTALLGVGADDAEALCAEVRGDDELVVANRNSPAQIGRQWIRPGDRAARGGRKGAQDRAVRLHVAGAFHSELMRPAVEPVLDVLGRIEIRDPVIPIAENVTGELVTEATRLRELVGRQVVSPVHWETGIRNLTTAGATAFLEAGPGEVLTKLMKRIDPDPPRSRSPTRRRPGAGRNP